MKVLLITDNHTVTGGAERYFFSLKERLQSLPDMNVFSLGFGEKEIIGDDFIVLRKARSTVARLVWRFFSHPHIASQIKKAIQFYQPDVIHIHNIKQYPISLLRAIKGYPVVQTTHDFSLICPTAQNLHQDLQPCATGIRRHCWRQHRTKFHPLTYLAMLASFYKISALLKKTCQKFIAPSPMLANYLERNGFHDSICIPPFQGIYPRPTYDLASPQRFLFAGNLGAHKGVTHLLSEFALACKINPELMLDIAGTGPLEARLRQQAVSLRIEKNIRFLGWQANLDPLYQQATALIFPSIGLESFGLVISEAMGHGRAVIGTHRGPTTYLVEDGKTGLLYDPLKTGDLAEKILALAANSELAKQLGLQGYQRLPSIIDNDTSLQMIVSVYREVCR